MWQDTLIQMLRAEINDFEALRYTDARLQKILVVSAFKVYQVAPFVTDYRINVNTSTIAPDPVVIDDYDFSALVVAQAACIILTGESREASGSAVMIKDGPSVLDNRDGSKNLIGLSTAACDNFKNLLNIYLMSGGNGLNELSTIRAVLTPYGSSSYNYKYWSNRKSD